MAAKIAKAAWENAGAMKKIVEKSPGGRYGVGLAVSQSDRMQSGAVKRAFVTAELSAYLIAKALHPPMECPKCSVPLTEEDKAILVDDSSQIYS